MIQDKMKILKLLLLHKINICSGIVYQQDVVVLDVLLVDVVVVVVVDMMLQRTFQNYQLHRCQEKKLLLSVNLMMKLFLKFNHLPSC